MVNISMIIQLTKRRKWATFRRSSGQRFADQVVNVSIDKYNQPLATSDLYLEPAQLERRLMASAEHTVWCYSPTGSLITVLRTGDWHQLRYTRRVNQVGNLVLTLPEGKVQAADIEPDMRLLVYRTRAGQSMATSPALDTIWLAQKRGIAYLDHAARMLTIEAMDSNGVLDTRIVAYGSNTPETQKDMRLDDMMKAVVKENLWLLADVAHDRDRVATVLY